MERQLKERLIGAAVLVAAAVIMVPEMFSGPRTPVVVETNAAKPAANQIKTYNVDLQATSAPATSRVETPVEPPAERPLDEAQAMPTATSPEIAAAAPLSPEPKPQSAVPAPETKIAESAEGASKATAKPEAKPAAANAGWAVQDGSFSARDTAQQIAAKLKTQGFAAFVAPVQVRGRTLYRVRVGDLADKSSAATALNKLRGNYPGASIIAPGH